ncbi:hypothetical protein LTR08_007312 [Meristemomyces frigidus]|nr:hypothetical protein LTR08_007312 [Meristemomyces frigidus]
MADIWKPEVTANGTILGSNATLAKRQLNSILTQKPDRTLYWINITIGTPGQPQALQLDTGSRSLWVPAKGSAICSSTQVPCSILGAFDSAQSSTFVDTDQSTTVGFADGGSVTGDWFYDTVHISGEAVTSQLTVLGTSGSGLDEGILGVGFPASYPTLNHNLAAQGVIASNSYSIWLDELSAAGGTILFGGLNLARFVAPLLKMPVVGGTTMADGTISFNQPTVKLSRVATLQGSQRTVQTAADYSEPAVLDTGTSLTVLQKPLADTIISAMGASYYPSTAPSGNTIIPCSAATSSQSLNFHFSDPALGPTINVPISELVLQALGSANGVEMCQFGIYSAAPADNLPTIMGDTFLRSAYVVYDLDTNHIGMAQTVFNPGPADIVEIPASGIPVGVAG